MKKEWIATLVSILFLITVQNVVTPSFSQQITSCQCVAFRLDDVQDFYLDVVNAQVVRVFQEKNASLSLGIVGNLFGKDEKLISLIKDRINDNNPILTISNHGWNHEDFTRLEEKDQSLLIAKTNEKLKHILGVRPTVFIPPFDIFNNDTLDSLKENGIKYISSMIDFDSAPYTFNDDVLPYHFPSTATTSDDNGTYWIGIKHHATTSQIHQSVLKYGFAVVEMHPYEYSTKHSYTYKPFDVNDHEHTFSYRDFISNWANASTDPTQIRELMLLIDEIRHEGYRIVPIENIP